MTPAGQNRPIDDVHRQEAARWIVRRDRGLSATESIEFELWLAADERHAVALSQYLGAWSMLDRIPDSVGRPIADRVTPLRKFWRRPLIAATVAAAALGVGFLGWAQFVTVRSKPAQSVFADAASPQFMRLSDNTVVRLKMGSEVQEHFTATARRVRLVRGEAYFNVTKHQDRPFIVKVGTVEVRAVGTAFNVSLQSSAVEVVVTEGQVQVNSQAVAGAPATPPLPILEAGFRAVVSLKPVSSGTGVSVTLLDSTEIARVLAWQEPLLRLGGASLAELAMEFERRSGYRLLLADAALSKLRIGGRFRADDIDGFVRLLEQNYGIRSERTSDRIITLFRASD